MLCLSRRKGQAIRIGNVIVKIGDHNRSRVQLIIDAPPEVEIRRLELVPDLVKQQPLVKVGEAKCSLPG